MPKGYRSHSKSLQHHQCNSQNKPNSRNSRNKSTQRPSYMTERTHIPRHHFCGAYQNISFQQISTISTCCDTGLFFCTSAKSGKRQEVAKWEHIWHVHIATGSYYFCHRQQKFHIIIREARGCKARIWWKNNFHIAMLKCQYQPWSCQKVKTGSKMISLYCDDLDFSALDNEEI